MTDPQTTDSQPFGGGSLEKIGSHTYEFLWPTGYYRTVFAVTGEGVIALDPISDEAAAGYRDAIRSVTDQPVRYVVYSHEHLDHITGAQVLAPDADVVAHRDVGTLLAERGHRHVPQPTVHVDGYLALTLGDVTWELYDLGPNHSRTSLAVVDRADRWVAAIDLIPAGLVPYRDLPLTDFHGYRATLDKLDSLGMDTVIDGHCPPADAEWIGLYRTYMTDLVEATTAARAEVNEATIIASGGFAPDETTDGVRMTDAMFDLTAERAVERLRADYGHWGGFEHWAPKNTHRALLWLITGE